MLDWQDAVSEDTTALIYMPGADYEELAAKLCADGLRPETPCLIVSHATTREQRMHATTLANLTEAPHYPAPVLLIVGAVAAKYIGQASAVSGSKDSTLSPTFTFDFALIENRLQPFEEPAETIRSAL